LFLGTVGACGFLLDNGEVDPFLINMTTGMDEKEIERLSEDIGTISSENAQSLILHIEENITKIIRNFENK
jgi:3-hydroxy-3-methylglutaryl CoA synthase